MHQAIFQTQLQNHGAGAISLDRERAKSQSDFKGGDQKQAETIQMARKRRNSIASDAHLIPDMTEQGYKSAARASLLRLNSPKVQPKQMENHSPEQPANDSPSSLQPPPKSSTSVFFNTASSLSLTTSPKKGQLKRKTTFLEMFRIHQEEAEKVPTGFMCFPILHPASGFRVKWDAMLALVLVWNLIEIPFQVCFNVEADPGSGERASLDEDEQYEPQLIPLNSFDFLLRSAQLMTTLGL